MKFIILFVTGAFCVACGGEQFNSATSRTLEKKDRNSGELGDGDQVDVRVSRFDDAGGNSDTAVNDVDFNGSNAEGASNERDEFQLIFDYDGRLSESESSVVRNAGVAGGSVQMTPFSMDDLGISAQNMTEDEAHNEILTSLSALYNDVNVSFSVRSHEDADTSKNRIYIGGMNFAGSLGITGKAPLDIGNFHKNDVLFVFSEWFAQYPNSENLDHIVNTVSHEVNHSLGARHIDPSTAIMNPVVSENSNLLNITGNIVGETGQENTYNVVSENTFSFNMLRLHPDHGSSGDLDHDGDSFLKPTVEAVDFGDYVAIVLNINEDHTMLECYSLQIDCIKWQYGELIVEGRTIYINKKSEMFGDKDKIPLSLQIERSDLGRDKEIIVNLLFE